VVDVIDAVFGMAPLALALIDTGNVIVVDAMASVAAVQVSVPLAMTHDHPAPVAGPVTVTPAGIGSVTVALRDTDGPTFLTVIVYVAVPPATSAGDTDFAIEMSATADNGVLSVEESFEGAGSGVVLDKVPMLATTPVRRGSMANTIVTGASAPTASGPCVHPTDPAASAHDHPTPAADTNVKPVGTASVSVTSAATDGPALCAFTVYETVLPATARPA
jgi:hypothetical protein